MLGCICVCLQQVDAAVVQQVGGALCSLLHHLVLVDDLHCLVVNAQPAVKTNVEDIRGVVTACCTVPMVIDNWLWRKQDIRRNVRYFIQFISTYSFRTSMFLL